MFKKTALIIAILSSQMAFAAGPYDGIYQLSYLTGNNPVQFGYVSVHENSSGQIVGLVLANGEGQWDALMGNRSGTAASITSLASQGYSTVNMRLDINFTSTTTLTATEASCQAYTMNCLFPVGTKFTGNKIF